MNKSNYWNKNKKAMVYISCFISFLFGMNDNCKKVKAMTPQITNINNYAKNIKNPQNTKDLRDVVELMRGQPITMPIFSNEANSVIAPGTVTYTLNDNKTIDVQITGIDNPGNLDVYLVPIVEDQIQPRVILQKVGNIYQGTAVLPKMEGRISLHFYFINPVARDNGPDPRFRIGAADICNIQNVSAEILSADNNKLRDVAFYNKEGQILTDRPTPYVYNLEDYIFILLQTDKPSTFHNRMMAIALNSDDTSPKDGSNDMVMSTFPVMDIGEYYCGVLIYKNIMKKLTEEVTVHFYKDVLLDDYFDSYLKFWPNRREQ